MSKKYRVLIVVVALVALAISAAAVYLQGHHVAVLQPSGQVGTKERNLMVFGLVLSVLVVVPTFALAIFIAMRYHEDNPGTKKKYMPDWDHSRLFESIWWGLPMLIIIVLSVVTWNSSHALDPYKSLVSTKKPLTIQVVALDWKWLFIYPDQHVASVNTLQIPVGTPVNFEITSDSVMNSFWIPSLGGQIYAMPGMNTELHLMANKAGSYEGSSANISGSGFASMDFVAKAGTAKDFDTWIAGARQSPNPLNANTYTQLAKLSKNNKPTYYSSTQDDLYNNIIMQYMMPGMDLNTHMTHSIPNTRAY